MNDDPIEVTENITDAMVDKAWPDLKRPTIVCLCGSTRFSEAFRRENLRETLAGRIVLSIGCDFKSDDALGLTEDDKKRLDDLHLRKIDLADEILVLNVDGYVGESTAREIRHAMSIGRKIRWLDLSRIPEWFYQESFDHFVPS